MSTQEMAQAKLVLASQLGVDPEICWMQGYAYGQKDLSSKNPYGKNSIQSRYWQQGYDAGMMDEAALFPEHQVEISLSNQDQTQTVRAAKTHHQHSQKVTTKSKLWLAGAAVAAMSTLVILGEVVELLVAA